MFKKRKIVESKILKSLSFAYSRLSLETNFLKKLQLNYFKTVCFIRLGFVFLTFNFVSKLLQQIILKSLIFFSLKIVSFETLRKLLVKMENFHENHSPRKEKIFLNFFIGSQLFSWNYFVRNISLKLFLVSQTFAENFQNNFLLQNKISSLMIESSVRHLSFLRNQSEASPGTAPAALQPSPINFRYFS